MRNFIKEAFADFFFEYETPRQVLVKNPKVGIACRILQLGVLAYIIGWVFIYEKGYQIQDTAISSVFTKMKGLAYTEQNGEERLWDVADYVFPDQGVSSFVVMTNFIMTVGQTQGKCPELADGSNNCTTDADCKKGEYKRTGNESYKTDATVLPFEDEVGNERGRMTGKCINGTCEIQSWCPVQDDRVTPNPPLLAAAENFTLFIKNSISFPEFGVVRSNLVESVTPSYMKTCLFDPDNQPLCPIFKLGDIVSLSGFQFSKIAQLGGSIGVLIEWECNLDLRIEKCLPKYRFEGLYGNNSAASVGYNFRTAKYYTEDKIQRRTLMKVFGLYIEIIVHGQARKFDIIPTLTAIGSGVGIFGVATVVCDVLLLHLVPKKNFYKTLKFKSIPEEEEEPESLKMDQTKEPKQEN
ncbi:P2X purinoceptor 1 isoform X1 [Hemibagrus wyckioides]|uniref:P2X purinoceptor 1 isoform X1 n=1 Tax=Hemibagrus wyckioides TaxID=337641 RepID=UPI00266C9223|nr:P2X purinoceptor 1 isoform X1 [Hemibagrus wyckioides]